MPDHRAVARRSPARARTMRVVDDRRPTTGRPGSCCRRAAACVADLRRVRRGQRSSGRVGDDHVRRRRTGCARSPRTAAARGGATGPRARSRTPRVAATSSATDSIRRPSVSRKLFARLERRRTRATARDATSTTISSCHTSSCRDSEPRWPPRAHRRQLATCGRDHNDHNDRCARKRDMPVRTRHHVQTTRAEQRGSRCKSKPWLAALGALRGRPADPAAAHLRVERAIAGTQIPGLRFMVPNTPGGGYDITARTAAKNAEDAELTHNIEVFNLPGAGGTVGLSRLVSERGNGKLAMSMGLGVVGAVRTNDVARRRSPTPPRSPGSPRSRTSSWSPRTPRTRRSTSCSPPGRRTRASSRSAAAPRPAGPTTSRRC